MDRDEAQLAGAGVREAVGLAGRTDDDVPAPDDPLLRAADVLLVDSRALGGLDCFSRLAPLVRTRADTAQP